MHPFERLLLKSFAEFDVSTIPDERAKRKGYAISLSMDDSISAKSAAFRLVDTLRTFGLLKGEAANVKMSDLENMKGSVGLGENARLIQDNTIPGGGVRLSLLFADATPTEVHTKIIKILGDLERDAARPSILQPAEDAIKSTFAAGGLPPKTVEAISNNIVLTFGKAEPFKKRQGNIIQALYDAELFKFDDVRSSPVIFLNKENDVTYHLSFPNKSLTEVQEGLFKAETLIRQRAEGVTPWCNQINHPSSTFVSGKGIGRQ